MVSFEKFFKQKILLEYDKEEGSKIVDLLKNQYKSRRIILTNGDFEIREFSPEEQGNRYKPNGTWYSLGQYWANWLSDEMPHWWNDYNKIYMLELDYSKILRINNIQKMRNFIDEYENEESGVNWRKVAERYSGIEIIPMIWISNSNPWYSTWDVPSGCIWDYSAIKRWKEIETPFINNVEKPLKLKVEDPYTNIKKNWKEYKEKKPIDVNVMDVVRKDFGNNLQSIPNDIIDKISKSSGNSIIFVKMLLNAGIDKIPQSILDSIKSSELHSKKFLEWFGEKVKPAYKDFISRD
jgi:hypothetical protein